MPLPAPHRSESKDDFIKRFMGSEVAQREFPDRLQRYAVAESKWKEAHKK